MITYIIIAVIAVVVLFIIIIATRPSESRITRTGTLSAPASVVFAQVNDLHKWEAWSPWAKMDPNAKNTYSGASSGTGASFTWAGNKQVGEGTMTITDSRPAELVRLRLEFRKPFAATNTAEFTFKANGPQTSVTWTMTGKNNFMFKAVGLFINCDKLVGGQFETGLAALKTISEAAARG